ncbi:MAG: transposase, partial [Acidimicrobiia bacterium]
DADRATNGRIEGTNNKLGVLKRIAYGFVNVTNFAARALLLTPDMAPSP